MDLTEPLTPIIRVFASIVTVFAWFGFVRHRDILRRNSALVATVTLVMLWYTTAKFPLRPFWLHAFGILSFALYPLVTTHLLDLFHRVPAYTRNLIRLGVVYVLLIILISVWLPLSSVTLSVFWAYYIGIQFFFCIQVLLSSFTARGVIRRRYRWIVTGGALFNGFLLLVVAIQTTSPLWLRSGLVSMLPLLIVAVIGAYWGGLNPPNWLRQIWTMTEIRGFFDRMMSPSMRNNPNGLVNSLLSASESLVSGVPILALWQSQSLHFKLYSPISRLDSDPLPVAGPISEEWQNIAPTYFDTIQPTWGPEFVKLAHQCQASAGYLVPFAAGHGKYGILIVFVTSLSHFPQDDLKLLAYLAEQSAGFMEIHQLKSMQDSLVQNLHSHSQRSQRLNKIMESVSHASLDGDAILIAVSRELSEQFGDGCVIYLVNPPHPVLELAASYHTVSEIRNNIHKCLTGIAQQSDDDAIAAVFTTRQPLLVNYKIADAPVTGMTCATHRHLATLISIHSSIYVPLRTGDQVLGLMLLFRESTTPSFTYEDLRTIETIADRVALALENAILFSTVQSELEERSRTEKALRESEARFASILAMAPDAIISIDNNQRIVNFNRGAEHIFGYEAKTVLGQPVRLLFSDDPIHQHHLQRRLTGPGSGPLEPRSHEEASVLYWRRKNGSHFPGEITLSRVKIGGRLIRTLMLRDITDRLLTEQEARKKTQILATMYATTLTLMDRLHVANSLETILRRAGQLLETENGFVGLLGPDGSAMEIKIGVGGFLNSIGYRIEPGNGISGMAWKAGELLYVNDYAQWEHRVAQPCVEGIRAAVCIPLFAESNVVGVLGLAHFESNQTFDEQDIELLNLFAPLASIALYNAQLFSEVERLAKTDDLTGLLNRRAFFQRAEAAFQQARTNHKPLSAIMLDIDHFKRVNDTFGHTRGDEVLRWIAAECQKLLRTPDVLARYGGEEFALLLPNTTLEEARRLAEQIRTHIAYHPIEMNRQMMRISLSLGVAAVSEDMGDVNDLLDLADSRLYGAKSQGRNQVVGSGYPHPTYVR